MHGHDRSETWEQMLFSNKIIGRIIEERSLSNGRERERERTREGLF